MKRSIAIIIAATCLMAACESNNEKAAKQVALNYASAMANYNIDKAESYITPESKETIHRARVILKAVGPDYVKQDTPATVEITSIDIVDDTIAKAVYHKTTPLKDFSDTLELRRRNSIWYAHCPLEYVPIPEGAERVGK